MLCFLAAVEMKPLTLWGYQSVAFMISARAVPFGTPDHLQDFRVPTLCARGGGLGLCGLRGLLAGLGFLLRRSGLRFAALGLFLALGRALLLGGTLLRGGLLRRDVRARFRNGGG